MFGVLKVVFAPTVNADKCTSIEEWMRTHN